MNRKILKIVSTYGAMALVLGLAIQSGQWLSQEEASAPASSQTDGKVDTTAKIKAVESYGKTPMGFEENIGQVDKQVKFMARGMGYSLFLTPVEAVLVLSKQVSKQRDRRGAVNDNLADDEKIAEATEPRVLRMSMVGANASPEMAGLDIQAAKSNYIHGNDQSQWKTGVNRYGRVLYHEVYDGIDLAFYGNQKKLEYDFIVKSGVSADSIRMKFAGADSMEVDVEGNLILHLGDEQVIQHAPIMYQDIQGKRQAVEGGYVLAADNEVAFEVASYDTAHALVIDPVLVYSTYLGGNNDDSIASIATDGAGNIYLTGQAFSSNFPVLNAIQPAFSGFSDIFITKLDTAGALVYSTYLGGNNQEHGAGLTVDGAGNIWATGFTASPNFPLLNAIQSVFGGVRDVFIIRLDASGGLTYSTYLGGDNEDRAVELALDESGNVWVTGYTASSNYPLLNAMQPVYGGGSHDVFITKLNASSGALLYSTYFGGNNRELGIDVVVDGSSNIWLTGLTESSDFPLLNSIQSVFGGIRDAFVIKVDASGVLLYSTYIGGSNQDQAQSIDVDGLGNIWVVGFTSSSNLPILNAMQPTYGGAPFDAFITRLNNSGELVSSTYLGGSGLDQGEGIVVDNSGGVWVTGWTFSSDFPLMNAMQPVFGGVADVFITRLDTKGALVSSTYFGGSSYDEGTEIAVDGLGNAYVAGKTMSSDFPLLNAIQTTVRGLNDGFITKLTQFCAVPPSGLVSWWDGDAVSGITASDIRGANHGTLINGATTTLGKVGNAFNLDGINDYITAPYVYTGPFTVNFWAKTNATNQAPFTSLFSSALPGHKTPFFQIDFGNVGNYRFNAGDLALNVNIGAVTTSFQHLAVTYDGSIVKTFLNGALQNSGIWMGPTLQFEVSKVGINRDENRSFSGIIDEVGLYSRALSQLEIQSIYNASSVGKCKVPATNMPPVADAGVAQIVECTGGSSASVAVNASGSSDPDGDALTYAWSWVGGSATGVNPIASFPLGTTMVTLTVDDANGHATTATTTVTVQDTTPPTVNTGADVTVEASSAAGAVFDVFAHSSTTDVCCSVSTNIAPVGTYPLGSTIVTVTAADCSSNTGSGQIIVTVQDTIAPILAQPANITGVEATSTSGAAATFSLPAATDTVDATPSVACAPVPGSTFAIGTTTVMCTATDHAAVPNSTQVSFILAVVDTTAPTVTAPANLTIEATASLTPVTLGIASASDLVDGTVATTPDVTGSFALGAHTITWSATDTHGNTGTATQTVTVTDTTAPELTVPADVSVEANAVLSTVTIGTASATDIFGFTITDDAPVVYGLGTTVVTYTATDANGNVSTGIQHVNVVDTTVPVVTADLTPFSRGDGEGHGKGDTDEGRFNVQFAATDLLGVASLTAKLVISGYATPIAVSLNQVIEFKYDKEKTQVETEKGVLEIEAPTMLLRVTAKDFSGNSAVVDIQSRGLTGDNDDESDKDDD